MKKPNILFFFPDQQRREWLSYDDEIYKQWEMEKPEIHMPNIKFIQSRGVTFLNAITPAPVCAPARACLAAGTRYDKCRTLTNNYDYPPDQPTFYTSLKNAGYHVCGTGKFDLQKKTCDWFNQKVPESLGFTDFLDNEGKLDCLSFTKKLGKPAGPYMQYLADNGLMQMHIDDMSTRKNATYPTPLPEEAYCDNWLSQNAIKIIDNIPVGEPWFMQINFCGPHGPFDITKRMKESVKDRSYEDPCEPNGLEDDLGLRQNYAAMIENIDRNIGLLLDQLKKRGELDNTVIVYSSDHGYTLGDHGKYCKAVPDRGAINIPMVISLPDAKRKGVYDTSLVELQDLAKTFTEIAGATFNCGKNDSLSLLPVLQDGAKLSRKYQIAALRNKQETNFFRCILDNDYKYYIDKNGKENLYNLKTDIWECSNIAEENKEIVKKYAKKLDEAIKL